MHQPVCLFSPQSSERLPTTPEILTTASLRHVTLSDEPCSFLQKTCIFAFRLVYKLSDLPDEPAEHLTHSVRSGMELQPDGQAVHSLFRSLYLPAGHKPHAASPSTAATMFSGHDLQMKRVAPISLPYAPASHLVH